MLIMSNRRYSCARKKKKIVMCWFSLVLHDYSIPFSMLSLHIRIKFG